MKFFIKTYGCQMNVNDSEKMQHILENRGLTVTRDEMTADIVIINSCAVREKPQDKIFSYAGRLPKDKIIIVAGCVAQAEKEKILERNPNIDYIVGTHQYYQVDRIVEEILGSRQSLVGSAFGDQGALLKNCPLDPRKTFNYYSDRQLKPDATPGTRKREAGVRVEFTRQWQEAVPDMDARTSRVSGYISIMEGCDNFCSYCIVPFTRGREKHRPFERIMEEAAYLADKGYKEIILLGQNVNNWEDKKKNMKFTGLLDVMAEKINVRWIRFITSYPGYYDNELIAVMARHRKIARNIHFPAQSGSTRILKKMNRIYTRGRYLDIIRRFKKRIPDITFSSDFIVGYPGESANDFKLTLSLVEKVQYENIFSFIYSPRRHTRAFKMEDKLSLEVKKQRLYELQELQKKIQLKNNKALIGNTVEVLITGRNPKKPGEVIARTASYRVVNFKSSTGVGEFTKVLIEGVGPYSLRGREVPSETAS